MQLLSTRWLMPSPHPEQWPPPSFVAQHDTTHTLWDIPWASLGHSSCLCHLPSPGAPPATSLAGQHNRLKSPWLSVSPALQQLKHQCVISIILILIPKHSTIPATRKKINTIPAKTWTYCNGFTGITHMGNITSICKIGLSWNMC